MTDQVQTQEQAQPTNRIAIPATVKCPTCSGAFHMLIDLGVNVIEQESIEPSSIPAEFVEVTPEAPAAE